MEMPDESCRTCGGELRKYTLCAECRKTLQWICKSCNFTTLETHPHCLDLENYQIIRERNPRVRTAYYQVKNVEEKRRKPDLLPKMLLAFGVLGVTAIILSGMVNFASIFDQLDYQLTHSEQSPKKAIALSALSSPPSMGILNVGQKINQSSRTVLPKYDNCIGAANGVFLTIKCPTQYGSSYISVVEMPNDLISQFGGKFFSIDKFSVSVGTDSLNIDYNKKQYLTNIITYWDSTKSD